MNDEVFEIPLVGWTGALARGAEPRQSLIEGLLFCDGLTLVSAGKGWGKTTFIVNLLTSIASGGDFLGMKTRKGVVLHYAPEETTAEYEQRLENMRFPACPEWYSYSTAAPRDRDSALSAVSHAIDQYHPVCVALDPVGDFLPYTDLNEYASKDAFRALKILRDRFPETHIIVTHHNTKSLLPAGTSFDKAMVTVNGSIAVQAYFTKMLLGVGSVEKDRRELLIWSRMDKPRRMSLMIDPTTERLTAAVGVAFQRPAAPARLTGTATRVLSFMGSAGESVTKTAIREHVRLPSASAASSVLETLQATGHIELDPEANNKRAPHYRVAQRGS